MEQEIRSTKIPFLKRDCKIEVTLGGQIINELAQLLVGLCKDRNPEEFKRVVGDKMKNKEKLDVFEQGILSLTWLLQKVQDLGVKQEQVEYKEMKDSISGMM